MTSHQSLALVFIQDFHTACCFVFFFTSVQRVFYLPYALVVIYLLLCIVVINNSLKKSSFRARNKFVLDIFSIHWASGRDDGLSTGKVCSFIWIAKFVTNTRLSGIYKYRKLASCPLEKKGIYVYRGE